MIGIFGGTFDPVHHGHLRMALELSQQFQFEALHLVPCGQPYHRHNGVFASAEDRRAMLALALADEAHLLLDDRELRRDKPSYSIDTLMELRAEYGADYSLCMIIGMDSLLGLQRWHRWQELFDYAHVMVITRPGWQVPDDGVVAQLLAQRQLHDPAELNARPAGGILLLRTTGLEISSSHIRELLQQQRSPRYLLPDAVLAYIHAHHLYQ